MSRNVMHHPKDDRVLTPDEESFVNECAQRTMQAHVTRGSMMTSADLAQVCYKTAFGMLDHRNSMMRHYDPTRV